MNSKEKIIRPVFIELTRQSDNIKVCININQIVQFQSYGDGVQIYTSESEYGETFNESYDDVLKIINTHIE